MISEYAHPDAYYGGTFQAAPEDHGTSHISVVDRNGNAVSVTSTINLMSVTHLSCNHRVSKPNVLCSVWAQW